MLGGPPAKQGGPEGRDGRRAMFRAELAKARGSSNLPFGTTLILRDGRGPSRISRPRPCRPRTPPGLSRGTPPVQQPDEAGPRAVGGGILPLSPGRRPLLHLHPLHVAPRHGAHPPLLST